MTRQPITVERARVPGRLRRGAVAAVAALALVLGACGTKDAPDPLEPTGALGRVRFVNVITDPTRALVNVALEGVPLGAGVGYGVTVPASLPAPSGAPYASILAGARSMVLRRTADTSVAVATLAFDVGDGEDRSVYAIGGSAGSAVTAFVTTDTNPAPVAAEVRLRAVHLSPTAGPVDLFVTAVGADLAAATPVVANLASQTASAYFTVPAATYQIRAVRAGTAAASRTANVVINLASVALAGGAARTIVAADNNVGGAPLRFVVLTDR
jgi:hypothetical protein